MINISFGDSKLKTIFTITGYHQGDREPILAYQTHDETEHLNMILSLERDYKNYSFQEDAEDFDICPNCDLTWYEHTECSDLVMLDHCINKDNRHELIDLFRDEHDLKGSDLI